MKWYNAVDCNDRDSADYSTTMRTTRYYLRMFFWALDRVIHCEYTIVCWCATYGIGNPYWKRYLKNGGRREFQIDLAIEIMNYGLWFDLEDGEQPSYVRDDFIPCDCKKCIFCLEGKTGVIRGLDKKKRKSVFHFKCGGRLVTEGCTKQRVNLDIGNQRCRMCYRLQDPAIPSREREKKCKFSRLGCPQCKEPICKECWAMGYDKHKKKDN